MRQIHRLRAARVRLLVGAALLSSLAPFSVKAESRMPVTVVVARESAVFEKVPVVGSVLPREEVQVFPAVMGREILEIRVEAGQRVEKGDVLAVLDTAEARLQLKRNAASLHRAKAAIAMEAARVEIAGVTTAETARVLERSLSLRAQNVISQQVLEQHQSAHDRATSELSLARQSLALVEADAALVMRERSEIDLAIERSTIRAPMRGLVLSRAARLGAMTSGSAAPLFVIAEKGDMEFVATVVETTFARLRDGMRAVVVVAGENKPVAGTVVRKAAALDAATRSGAVHVRLEVDAELTPGSFAQAQIALSERRNIFLPASAVRATRGTDTIVVVTEGAVDIRTVAVGTRQGGRVEIIDGLSSGEMVVLKAGGFLKPNDKVKPVVVALEPGEGDEVAASLPAQDDAKELR